MTLDIENIVGAVSARPHRMIADTTLIAIVYDMISQTITTKEEMTKFIHRCSRVYHVMASKKQILYTYRSQCAGGVYTYDGKYAYLLQSKAQRGESGVMVIATFTSPFPMTQSDRDNISVRGGDVDDREREMERNHKFSCQYDCWFCPAEPGQPRSYLLREPGVLRANANKFDAADQFYARADSYTMMGHPVTKIEILVLGGTVSSYKDEYIEEFIRDTFYAANTYYNSDRVTNPRPRMSITDELLINETTQCRIIGLTLETRPDRITSNELIKFRRWGVTRVQIGVQHTDDRMLNRSNRGCVGSDTVRALRLLKDNCFKVDGHFMHDLPQPFKIGTIVRGGVYSIDDIDRDYSVYSADLLMNDVIVNHPDWQFDQLKLYPFTPVPYSKFEHDFQTGIHVPYGGHTGFSDRKTWTRLGDVLVNIMSNISPYVRLNRIIRDIPNEYILGGNQNVNLRQDIESVMRSRKLECADIREREVGSRIVDGYAAVLVTRQYESSGGTEYFLSFESLDFKTLFGFLRLRLSPNSGINTAKNSLVFPELIDCALIRELHVYGRVVTIDHHKSLHATVATQHCGFGSRLVERAIKISHDNKYSKIAVISGVGVKEYYRRLGFTDSKSFMTRVIHLNSDISVNKEIIDSFDKLYISHICKGDKIENSNNHYPSTSHDDSFIYAYRAEVDRYIGNSTDPLIRWAKYCGVLPYINRMIDDASSVCYAPQSYYYRKITTPNNKSYTILTVDPQYYSNVVCVNKFDDIHYCVHRYLYTILIIAGWMILYLF